MSGSAQKFTTNPVDVDAYQWDGTVPEMYFVIGWILNNGGVAWVQDKAGSKEPEVIRLETTDGSAIVSPKDWVVRDSQSKFHVVKPKIFDSAYTIKE